MKRFSELSDFTKEQIKELQTKADAGDAESQRIIGDLYWDKSHYNINANKWWEKSAEQGNITSQERLGVFYSDYPREEYCIAAKWYKKAAEQGSSFAQYHLGEMYDEGHGVRQNLETALEWYTTAANNNSADAQLLLGKIYEEGLRGVTADFAIAKEWYGRACDNGNDDGCDNYRRLNEAGY